MPFSSPNDKQTLNGYFSERAGLGFLKIAVIVQDNCKKQDVHALTLKSISILLNSPFKLKLKAIALQF